MKEVKLGFMIRNIGTQFTSYSGVKEKLPMEILLGVSAGVRTCPIHLASYFSLQQWNIAFRTLKGASIDGSTTEEKFSYITHCAM
jgi:hypothetical protein